MSEHGYRPEHRDSEQTLSASEVKAFLTQKLIPGETINVERSNGSKNTGSIHHLDRSTGSVTVQFTEDGKTKFKTIDLLRFLKWQGISVDLPPEQVTDTVETGKSSEKILSAGGLVALGALITYGTAKMEGLMYPHLLEHYNASNSYFEDMRVFVAHHYANNPTTTMLVGTCIASAVLAIKLRMANRT